jgi:general secretion pathway protein F
VRHGGQLSDALTPAEAPPPMAICTAHLEEETVQLLVLAGRIAFCEAKLQARPGSRHRVAGPLAIIVISGIVGGLHRVSCNGAVIGLSSGRLKVRHMS